MDYKQLNMPAMKIVGVGVDTSTQNAPKDCYPAWLTFMALEKTVPHALFNKKLYGISVYYNNQACTFHYVAGIEVRDFAAELPKGLEKLEVPPAHYLVFTHKGKLDQLGQTYALIMEELAKTGKTQGDFWVEYYDERWKNNSDDSEFDIWIPVV
jgi:AraC family transcriptional regulator